MEEILKTTLLEFEKSSFLIDLIKHSKGLLYIKIGQTIFSNDKLALYQEIKINPSILNDLLEVLKDYQKNLPRAQTFKGIISETRKDELISRYFKGVPIKDLALQFDCSISLIEQILNNKKIPIVDNSLPKERRIRKRKRKPRK